MESRTEWRERKDEEGSAAKRQTFQADWDALPEDLLARIMSRLPFSSLVRSRSVCKKWRDLALSPEFTFSINLASKCVPIYFSEGPLQVYNSKSNAWELQSLKFLGVPHNSLALLVSAGGLLCFKNKVSGDFIVCNPITKRWRVVALPPGFDHRAIKPPQPGRKWTVLERGESVSEFYQTFGREGIVGLLTEKYERKYKLIVAGIRDEASWERPTLIYDSLARSWTKGCEVPRGVRFWESGKPIYYKDNFYCVTWSKGLDPDFCALRSPWSIVKYNVKNDCWSEYNPNVLGCLIPQLVEHRERGYLVQKYRDVPTALYFEELEKPEETARSLWNLANGDFPTIGDWCIGQGDCLYIGSTCASEANSFSVLSCDLTRNDGFTGSVWDKLPTLFDHTKLGPSLTWLRTLEASMTAAV